MESMEHLILPNSGSRCVGFWGVAVFLLRRATLWGCAQVHHLHTMPAAAEGGRRWWSGRGRRRV